MTTATDLIGRHGGGGGRGRGRGRGHRSHGHHGHWGQGFGEGPDWGWNWGGYPLDAGVPYPTAQDLEFTPPWAMPVPFPLPFNEPIVGPIGIPMPYPVAVPVPVQAPLHVVNLAGERIGCLDDHHRVDRHGMEQALDLLQPGRDGVSVQMEMTPDLQLHVTVDIDGHRYEESRDLTPVLGQIADGVVERFMQGSPLWDAPMIDLEIGRRGGGGGHRGGHHHHHHRKHKKQQQQKQQQKQQQQQQQKQQDQGGGGGGGDQGGGGEEPQESPQAPSPSQFQQPQFQQPQAPQISVIPIPVPGAFPTDPSASEANGASDPSVRDAAAQSPAANAAVQTQANQAIQAAGQMLVGAILHRHEATITAGWWHSLTHGISHAAGAIGHTLKKFKEPIAAAAAVGAGAAITVAVPGAGIVLAPIAGNIAHSLVESTLNDDPKKAPKAKALIAQVQQAAQTDPHIATALDLAQRAVATTTAAYHIADTAQKAAQGDIDATTAIQQMHDAALSGDSAAEKGVQIVLETLRGDGRAAANTDAENPIDTPTVTSGVLADPRANPRRKQFTIAKITKALNDLVFKVFVAIKNFSNQPIDVTPLSQWEEQVLAPAVDRWQLFLRGMAQPNPGSTASTIPNVRELHKQFNAIYRQITGQTNGQAQAPAVVGDASEHFLNAAARKVDDIRRDAIKIVKDAIKVTPSIAQGFILDEQGPRVVHFLQSPDEAEGWFDHVISTSPTFAYVATFDATLPTWPMPSSEQFGGRAAQAMNKVASGCDPGQTHAGAILPWIAFGAAAGGAYAWWRNRREKTTVTTHTGAIDPMVRWHKETRAQDAAGEILQSMPSARWIAFAAFPPSQTVSEHGTLVTNEGADLVTPLSPANVDAWSEQMRGQGADFIATFDTKSVQWPRPFRTWDRQDT
jgi:hypothetical protein